MPDHFSGNVQPSLDQNEHVFAADAKRMVSVGFDGASYIEYTAFNHTASTALAVQLVDSPAGNPYGGPSPNHTMYNLGVTTAPIELIGANTARTRLVIEMDSSEPDVLYAASSSHASLSELGMEIAVGGRLIDDGHGLWQGAWTGVGAANCTVRIHEWYV